LPYTAIYVSWYKLCTTVIKFSSTKPVEIQRV
jgi:hypothetical protein